MVRKLINIAAILGLVGISVVQIFSHEIAYASLDSAVEESSSESVGRSVLERDLRGLDFVPGEIIIGLVEEMPQDLVNGFDSGGLTFGLEALDSLNRELDLESIVPVLSQTASITLDNSGNVDLLNLLERSFVLNFPETNSVPGLIKRLTELGEIAFAEPNYIYSIAQGDSPQAVDVIPNDDEYNNQDYLGHIDAPAAWDVITGTVSTTIAILDTGVLATHEDLISRIVLGHDYIDNDEMPDDENGHGTEMAGIIGAETNNEIGVVGLDWNAQILIIKIADSLGNATSQNIAAGITAAVDAGADIINISLGSTSSSIAVRTAVEYAYANDVTIIAAAGNGGSDVAFYPASFPHVMSVAAVNRTDGKSTAPLPSNYNYSVDLSAPGELDDDPSPDVYNIYTTKDDGLYGDTWDGTAVEDEDRGGTSASAAIVSGVAGLVKAQHPTWTPDQVMAQLAGTSYDHYGDNPAMYDHKIGAGRVEADAAVSSTAQGYLSYAGYSFDDFDGDGLASPGDVITISVNLKTYYSQSVGITGTLIKSSDYQNNFICSTDVITYTEMAFGVITPSSLVTCTIDTETPLGYDVDFDFTTLDGIDGPVDESFKLIVHPKPLEGWPVNSGLFTFSTPALADLDGDDSGEIFLGSIEASLRGWDVTGTLLSDWPQKGGPTFGNPAIADLDRDGVDEIIMPGVVYHADGSPMEGWPVDIPTDPTCGFITAPPAVGDITGDGFLNIVFGSWDHNIYAYNIDGSLVEGWPKDVGASVYSALALADVGDDDALEVIASTTVLDISSLEDLGTPLPDMPLIDEFCLLHGDDQLHVLSGDGSYFQPGGFNPPGWPQDTTISFLRDSVEIPLPVLSSPVLGDVNNDGELDIIVGNQGFTLNGDNMDLPKAPIRMVLDSSALADMVNKIGPADNGLEIIYISALGFEVLSQTILPSEIHVVNRNGDDISGWPVEPGVSLMSAPIVVDLDGDGSFEVMALASDSTIFAYDSDGDPVDGFPMPLGGASMGGFSSIAAGDVDNDGILDFFAPVGNKLYAWEMDQTSGEMPWPGYKHDLWNTGNYDEDMVPSQGAITINDFDLGTSSSVVTLTLSAPGADEMCISNSTYCPSSSWITYTTSMTWTLSSGSGNKTVYAEFGFPSGPDSERVQDSIFLDLSVPTVEITSPISGTLMLARRSIPVSGTAEDSDFVKYETYDGAGASPGSWNLIGIDDSEVHSASLVGTFFTDNAPDGTNTLRLTATDEGGNIGEDTVTVELGRIRDVVDTLTPTWITAGEMISFTVDVSHPMTEELNINTDTTFWLHDQDARKAVKVPPFNPTGPFSNTLPVGGIWYAQTFTSPETFLLSKVGVPISFTVGSKINLEVRPVDGLGKPTYPILGKTSTSGFFLGTGPEIIFDDLNVWIQEGETYAVVIKPILPISSLFKSDKLGSLGSEYGSVYEYAYYPWDIVETWSSPTEAYRLPLQLYQPLAYSATLTSATLLPISTNTELVFETEMIPTDFGPQGFAPTITYSGTEGISEDFFTFTRSDVNRIGLIGDPPTVTVEDGFMIEPISGTLSMPFVVHLSNTSYYSITIPYTTTDDTAVGDSDFEYITGTLVIESGNLFGAINIPIFADEEIEEIETFNLVLGEPNHAILVDDLAVGTIYDSDYEEGLYILPPSNKLFESAGIPMPFLVINPYTTTEIITVDYQTDDISATGGVDYIPITGTLTFTPGELPIKIIYVHLMDDTRDEPTETFSVTLSNVTSGYQIASGVSIGEIADDDGPYNVYLPLVMKNLGGGSTNSEKSTGIKISANSLGGFSNPLELLLSGRHWWHWRELLQVN